MTKKFEIANLSQDKLDRISEYEQKLQEEMGEEIVLIAYEECEK
ncbi:hypothetical protein ACQCU1_09510 [Sutcliffiella horikoshii]|nr:hypothetical protein [Sutcliffiella horikoshii]